MSKKVTGNDLKNLIKGVLSEAPEQRRRLIRRRITNLKDSGEHGFEKLEKLEKIETFENFENFEKFEKFKKLKIFKKMKNL